MAPESEILLRVCAAWGQQGRLRLCSLRQSCCEQIGQQCQGQTRGVAQALHRSVDEAGVACTPPHTTALDYLLAHCTAALTKQVLPVLHHTQPTLVYLTPTRRQHADGEKNFTTSLDHTLGPIAGSWGHQSRGCYDSGSDYCQQFSESLYVTLCMASRGLSHMASTISQEITAS